MVKKDYLNSYSVQPIAIHAEVEGVNADEPVWWGDDPRHQRDLEGNPSYDNTE